jgi:lipid II:glycine glycyltransferase (peptidoglycan interpeptide bridge formation enzyme)
MMIFYFKQAKTFHFQYLAPDDSKRETSATTALFVNAMREAAQAGCEKFSWGISTEDGGAYLNENLYRFKESFGALPCLNARYEK